MFLSISLLDYLHSQINPVPLSYLHGLDDLEGIRLFRAVEKLPPEAASLEEWNDALLYLTQAPPEKTVQAARARLICLLSDRKK